jgi:predicted acylesterase/phospholipase RssA
LTTKMKPSPIDVLRARRAGTYDHYRVALVVEGGCMRGVISAGAVTALEQLHLAQRFDAVYGVSAGALDCAYMLAGQAAMGTTIYVPERDEASALRAGPWTGLACVERVVGERVDRRVLDAHAWR